MLPQHKVRGGPGLVSKTIAPIMAMVAKGEEVAREVGAAFLYKVIIHAARMPTSTYIHTGGTPQPDTIARHSHAPSSREPSGSDRRCFNRSTTGANYY